MNKTVKLVAIAAGFFILGVSMKYDNQPKMREALGHLQAAKNSLNAATADKGGHRVKAMSLVKQAIEQVEKGIAFDNKH